jgi:hypothetical protein
MATTITIELRQKDSKAIVANGEYEIILGNEIQIDEGDVIQLREAFIDTLDESNIIIPNDINLKLETGLIYRDWYAGGNKNYVSFDPPVVPLPPVAQINYNSYRFTPYLKSEDDTSFQTVVGFEFNLDGTASIPSILLNYQYVGIDDNIYTFSRTLPEIVNPTAEIYTDDFINNTVVAKVGSFICLNVFLPPGITQRGVSVSDTPYKMIEYKPYNLITNILLPAGSYNPTELSIFISEQLASVSNTAVDINNPQYKGFVFNNVFLWGADDFQPGMIVPGSFGEPGGIIPPEGTYYLPQNDVEPPFGFTFKAGSTDLIGASQVALEFNQINNKFEFTFAHLPMYDSTNGTNIVVRYMNSSELGLIQAPDGGGIYFQNLSATNVSDGSPFDFWEGVLGFNLDKMLVPYERITVGYYGLEGRIYRTAPFVDGVNTVTGYAGLDSLVVKGKTTWFNKPNIPLDNQDGISSTITNTISIRAETDITQLLNKFSHYIVATDLNFANNNYIASESNFRTFNGIVSKYYSYDSYTYGDSVSAIQYQHAGATQALKSIRVRILKSDKTPDTNLLADNTIILQIIKAPDVKPPSGRLTANA